MSENIRTPAQKIFNDVYICQIQYMHTLSDVKMNVFGIGTTGNIHYDDATLRQWVSVQLTIAQMAEMFSQGINIILQRPDDSVQIYEVVTEHLRIWHNHVKNNINVGKVPIDDLRKMDDFANAVFPVSSRYKKPEELKISKTILDLINRGPKGISGGNLPFKGTSEEVQTSGFSMTLLNNTEKEKNKEDDKHSYLANAIAREFGNKVKGY